MEQELVEQAKGGDSDAFARLYDTWFDRVYDLAYRILRNPESAADTAQQAFLTAYRDLERLRDASAFGGWLLRITRNAALDHQRRESHSRPVDDMELAVIGAPESAVAGRLVAADDPARAVADADLAALVWESAEALGERDAEVLDLSLRHELAPAEIAEVIGTNRNHANQLVHRARNRLGDALRARVLWHGGDPVCPDLATALTEAGIAKFGADAVRVTTAHAGDCEQCEERRKLKLAPAALFSAVPMLSAPVALRQRVSEALAAEGVPVGDVAEMGGSTPPRPPRSVAKIATWAAVGAAAVAAGTLGVMWLTGGDDDSDSSVATEQGTTSPTVAIETTPSTLPIEAPTDTGADAPPATTGPEIVSPPATDPPPPTDPPITVTISFSIEPGTFPRSYPKPDAPALSWMTSGGVAVSVAGPGVSAGGASGSVPICPDVDTGSFCTSPAGTYTYVLTLNTADGQTETREAVLTLT